MRGYNVGIYLIVKVIGVLPLQQVRCRWVHLRATFVRKKRAGDPETLDPLVNYILSMFLWNYPVFLPF